MELLGIITAVTLSFPSYFAPNPSSPTSDFYAEDISEGIDCEYIENRERAEEANIPPAVTVQNVEAREEELIGGAVRADLTATGGISVCDISSGIVDEHLKILGTGLPARWLNGDKLFLSAADILLAKSLPDESFNQIRIRGESIHPSPPPKSAIRLEHAVEC